MWFKPYILFCPHTLTNFGYEGKEAIDAARTEVLRAIWLCPQERFKIKMHPSQDDSYLYRDWKALYGIKNAEVIHKANTAKLIARAKLVIVQHSTVALEALELGVPVILMEDEVSDVLGEFAEFGGLFMRARTCEDILRLIS